MILVVGLVDYHYYAAFSRPMYIATAALLAVIFVIGEVSFGARRWLDTGLFFIQPAELAKIIMVLVLADFFARHRDDPKDLRWVFRSFLLTASVVIWILSPAQSKQFDRDFCGMVCLTLVGRAAHKISGDFQPGSRYPGGRRFPIPGNIPAAAHHEFYFS